MTGDMRSSETSNPPPETKVKDGGPERTRPYEPPRLSSKRPVERVTLLSGDGGPGGGIGGE